MRSYTLFVLILFLFGSASAQNKVAFSKLEKGTDGKYYYNGQLYSGESLLLWPSNNKYFQQIEWLNGQIHGLYKSWYEDGKEDQVIEYQYGKRHGSFKSFYPNGAPEVQCSYHNGKSAWNIIGIHRHSFSDGFSLL